MQDIALLFHSLDDENRLRILALLLQKDELCVCDLVNVLQLPQSTISRQLSLLKGAGWLTDRRERGWSHYSINRSLSPIQQFMVPVLRNFLAGTVSAARDLERLRTLDESCRCR